MFFIWPPKLESGSSFGGWSCSGLVDRLVQPSKKNMGTWLDSWWLSMVSSLLTVRSLREVIPPHRFDIHLQRHRRLVQRQMFVARHY